jgi:hypothetical protein
MTHTKRGLARSFAYAVNKQEANTYFTDITFTVPSSNKKVDASLAGPPDPGGLGKGHSLPEGGRWKASSRITYLYKIQMVRSRHKP